jgi:hypothetical protein
MKLTMRRFLVLALQLPLLLSATQMSAAESANPSQATVTGLLGLAQVARAGGGFAPVKVGTVLNPGDLVQTANGSALDLSFGKMPGVVRLLQSTTVEFAVISSTNLELKLKGGELVTRWKKPPAGSKFQIEVQNGIAGILEGDMRLDARGHLVLLEGTALFVETREEAEPLAHTLKAEKPIYYSPTEHSVRPAPKELQRELSKQLKAKLPKK